MAVSVLALVVTAAAPSHAVVLLAAAVSSVGIQTVLVLVRTSVMAVDPKARSRLNTALVVGNFIGGAIGSTLAAILWGAAGRPLTGGAAGAVALVGLVVRAAQRRRALA